MVSRSQVYRCNTCGNIVEVLEAGGGKLVCCSAPMELLVENTVDAAQEKHVPVAQRSGGVVRVTVGSVSHPMEPEHQIEWIELLEDGKVQRQYLAPGQSPVAEFEVASPGFTVREYCNLHGLWRAQTE